MVDRSLAFGTTPFSGYWGLLPLLLVFDPSTAALPHQEQVLATNFYLPWIASGAKPSLAHDGSADWFESA